MPPKNESTMDQKLEVFKEQIIQSMSDKIDIQLKNFLKKDVNKIFLDIKKEIQDLVKSVEYCSNKIDDFENEIKKTNEHQKKNESRIEELQKEIQNLKLSVNHIQQSSLETSIEIQGIAVKKNDDLRKPIEMLMSTLDCSDLLKNNSVVNYYNNPAKQIITIQFNTKESKDQIIRQKKIKGIFTPKDIMYSDSTDKIFINEKLTPKNKQLLWLAKSTKALGYKYVWTKGGNVLLRKSDDSPTIRINDANDIPSQ